MAPCEPRFLFESAGEEKSSPVMRTIPQTIRVGLAILGEKRRIIHHLHTVSTPDGLCAAAVKAFTLRKNAQLGLAFPFPSCLSFMKPHAK